VSVVSIDRKRKVYISVITQIIIEVVEMVRVGQDRRTSAHFVAIDNKCYLFYCSCDAFTLFLKDYEEKILNNEITEQDIEDIADRIAEYEDYVRCVDNYEEFVEELQEIAENLKVDVELVDIEEEFLCEECYQSL